MEVLVRYLDEAEDLIVVFLLHLMWRTSRIHAKQAALLGCALYLLVHVSVSVFNIARSYSAPMLAVGA